MNVDPRGAYLSGGNLQYFGPQDALDGYDVIEFLARQRWCNGKVGMNGNGWYATSQWFIAAERPPHLARSRRGRHRTICIATNSSAAASRSIPAR